MAPSVFALRGFEYTAIQLLILIKQAYVFIFLYFRLKLHYLTACGLSLKKRDKRYSTC